ncbi:MAG: L-arabinose isomerase [Oscillospiraceae bacterium]|nr:L-arabinose isomerase [Oscillospiraceae bacterium]
MKNYEFWFITGSQHLYGEDTLRQVAEDSGKIVETLNKSDAIPCRIVFKPTVTRPGEITSLLRAANFDDQCAGVITWMHTFSPSKMWINGLKNLTKPYLHLHTQFNRDIPWDSIDMDFMNLNQSAHGDREHGFIGARLRIPRKIVAGHFLDAGVQQRIGSWQRSAVGAAASNSLKLMRLGDNMRQVAVTEGDKVEAEIKLGWDIEYYGVGDLVSRIADVTDADIKSKLAEYSANYTIKTRDTDPIKYQAGIECALEKMLVEGGFNGFTTNFEDLTGLEQLPGLAAQNLMSKGYGFAGEGDWKTAAMTYIIKAMLAGDDKGTSFMEDYTYHMEPGNGLILGAHMLEVCPSIAAKKPTIDVHPLGIGNRRPPARLVFDGKPGAATVTSLIDMGGRMRMIVNDINCVKVPRPMPKLPVARVMWAPEPSLETSAECWILAGGAHHSVLSYSACADMLRDFARIMDIEFVHINKDSNPVALEKELLFNETAYKLR